MNAQMNEHIEEVAWSALSDVRCQSTVVGADYSDMVEAPVQQSSHGDYEDNLVIAAALRAGASHIVSSDKQLQARSPIPCVGLHEAIVLNK